MGTKQGLNVSLVPIFIRKDGFLVLNRLRFWPAARSEILSWRINAKFLLANHEAFLMNYDL